MVKYRVVVNRDVCISCGAAPVTCPELFELGNDNGKNRVTEKYSVETDEHLSIGIIPPELYECAMNATGVCPVSAISVLKLEE
ncbi:MAG: ferredoxin [Desulfurococcaceae archaeon]